jgi:hypothetical protein
MTKFILPTGLVHLMEIGIWPSANGPAMTAQQFNPLVTTDRVRRFAPDESLLCLQPPPFRTIADFVSLGGAGDFWERFGALHQIEPTEALVIGDFGMGSDSPIILHFAANATSPPVLRLRWLPESRSTTWVQGARDFNEFALLLGLMEGVA